MIRAELVYAVREELAATVGDVLGETCWLSSFTHGGARGKPLLWSVPSSERNSAGTTTKSNPPVNAYVSHINRLLDLAGLPRETSEKSVV